MDYQEMQRRLRLARHLYHLSRDERRKYIKQDLRKRRIRIKVTYLLNNCPASIEEVISKEDLELLEKLYDAACRLELDYYPIPKRLHNLIRGYAHRHKVGFGISILDWIERRREKDRLTSLTEALTRLSTSSSTFTPIFSFMPYIPI